VLQKRAQHIASELEKLVGLYSDVEGPTLNRHFQRTWTFTHSCGTRQTWTFSNLLKQLKERPNAVPCKTCGGKERMSKAMAAFVEKYGIRDIEVWARYSKKVRTLTERVYLENIDTINPERHKRTRGSKGWHLDHHKAIVQCFLDGEPPEAAARVENLQMLPAFDNLSKGRR
jgi:hypothetical protein